MGTPEGSVLVQQDNDLAQIFLLLLEFNQASMLNINDLVMKHANPAFT